jgi:hypothetical protein
MKHLTQRPWAAVRFGLIAILVAACGGGVETGGTGPTGGAYVEGPITGFGSIIVAGVRFDDTTATVEDGAGLGRGRDGLRLGMRVEVDSGAIADDGSGARAATATRVRIASDLVGPVTTADASGRLLAVLGQSVRITQSTVVDGVPGGAAALAAGDIVEVHGFIDPGASLDSYVATRIERRSTSASAYRVRGLARDLSGTSLRVGARVFDLAAVGVPAGLVDGQVVRLTLGTTATGASWPVTAVAVEPRRLDDREEAEVEGLITSVTSVTRFAVNGIDVDATAATFVDGTGGVLLGARVKVRGTASGGLVVARSVDLRDDSDAFNDGFDLRDVIADLDTAAKTFRVRGVTVFYGTVPAPRYDNGGESDLRNDRRVRVRAQLSADRTRVEATRIEFVNN